MLVCRGLEWFPTTLHRGAHPPKPLPHPGDGPDSVLPPLDGGRVGVGVMRAKPTNGIGGCSNPIENRSSARPA